MDITGIKFLGDSEWQACKVVVPANRHWRKEHLALDTVAPYLRAVVFTPRQEGDSYVLPDMLGRIPENKDIGTVTAGGSYDNR